MKSTRKKPEARAAQSRRESNVSSRRKRILESARTLLTEDGQDGLSMRKLAKKADLSVTTLYNLVGSREEILRALIEDSADRFESTVTLPEESGGDALERTVKAFENVLRYLIDDAPVLKPLIVANIATGYVEELGKEEQGLYLRGAKDAVRECLRDALAEGLIRDVVSLRFLERQFYVGLELALDRWAFGLVDEDDFKAKCKWGAYLTLLAFASPDNRPRLEKELRRLEHQLKHGRGSGKEPPKAMSQTEQQPEVDSWTS
jgi:AcrR family transcriptional regulator